MSQSTISTVLDRVAPSTDAIVEPRPNVGTGGPSQPSGRNGNANGPRGWRTPLVVAATACPILAATVALSVHTENRHDRAMELAYAEIDANKNATIDRIQQLESSFSANYQNLDQSVAGLKSGLAEVTDLTRDRLSEAMDGAADSVWLLGVTDGQGTFAPIGTGWVIADGKIATNAHVLKQMADVGDLFESPAFVGRNEGREIALSDDFAIHPAYERWGGTSGPLIHQFQGDAANALVPMQLILPGDVGLIDVVSGSAGSPLPLSGTPDVAANSAVGYVGFPMENIAGLPSQQALSGRVTASTDFFFGEDPVDENLLIHYDAVTVGGSSGSPLFDDRGEVIGIVCAASSAQMAFGGRAPVGINYAQDVRLATELLNGTADSVQRERDTRWVQRLQEAALSPADVLDGLAAATLEIDYEQTQPIVSLDLELDTRSDSSSRQWTLSVEPGYRYVVVAVAHDWTDIDLFVLSGNEVVARDRSFDWFPIARIAPQSEPTELTVQLSAPGPDLSEDATPITLKIFRVREPGS